MGENHSDINVMPRSSLFTLIPLRGATMRRTNNRWSIEITPRADLSRTSQIVETAAKYNYYATTEPTTSDIAPRYQKS